MTLQTAEFDGKGRRIKNVVTNAGDFDKTEVYLWDGQKLCKTLNGQGNIGHRLRAAPVGRPRSPRQN